MLFKLSSLVSVASLASLVAAHGVITAVKGANGVTTNGFANVEGTPRTTDATTRQQEVDTPVIRADDCGKTRAGGNVDIAEEMAKITDMPSVGANGNVAATLHQVNGDGAGPYTMEVSPSGAGGDWVNMAVTSNVPGSNSRSRAKATDFALAGTIPAGTKCTGGADGATCLIRAKNDANAGPFGGCFAVTQADAASSAAGAAAPAPASASSAASALKRQHSRDMTRRSLFTMAAPLGA